MMFDQILFKTTIKVLCSFFFFNQNAIPLLHLWRLVPKRNPVWHKYIIGFVFLERRGPKTTTQAAEDNNIIEE